MRCVLNLMEAVLYIIPEGVKKLMHIMSNQITLHLLIVFQRLMYVFKRCLTSSSEIVVPQYIQENTEKHNCRKHAPLRGKLIPNIKNQISAIFF